MTIEGSEPARDTDVHAASLGGILVAAAKLLWRRFALLAGMGMAITAFQHLLWEGFRRLFWARFPGLVVPAPVASVSWAMGMDDLVPLMTPVLPVGAVGILVSALAVLRTSIVTALWGLIGGMIDVVATPLVCAGILWAASEASAGRPVSTSSALRAAVGVWRPLQAMALPCALAVAFSMLFPSLLQIVFLIMLVAPVSIASAAVVLEGRPGLSAVRLGYERAGARAIWTTAVLVVSAVTASILRTLVMASVAWLPFGGHLGAIVGGGVAIAFASSALAVLALEVRRERRRDPRGEEPLATPL